MIDSATIALRIAKRAGDIHAAMTVYERLHSRRDSLIAATEHLVECMEWELAMLRRKREEEQAK